ncbi:MAG TPA: hypothetical protein VLG11_00775 [Candidatus Saccharimonadales bacterium]|nr:hypothetical protein [Candidatus Saccharimonadales bacterium]
MDEDQQRQNDPAADNPDGRPTPDDALEPAGDLFNPVRDEEKLEEDNDSPAAPADDNPADGQRLPADHPEFDYASDIDEHEKYDEGASAATGVNDQEEHEHDSPRPLEPEE